MRVAILFAGILVLGVLAGCSTPAQPPPPAPPAPAPILIGEGDLRLPVSLGPLRQGDIPSFPIFADRPTNMTGPGSSHRETSLAVSPADTRVVLACDPSGVPNVSGGQSYFYLSTDNGTKWTDLKVEGTTDPRRATFEGGDCDVAIDAAGTLYTADTWLGDLSIGSSKDNGNTWTVGNAAAGTAPVIDRPWIVGGPAGTLYLTYQDVQFGMPSLIWFTKSTDYGLTFLPAVPVATATADGPYTWEGNFAPSADGTDLYSVYTRRETGVVGSPVASDAESVFVSASHDGGLSWTSHLVSKRTVSASYLYPSIGLDAGGQLHVVFSQATENGQPIWYSTSKDQGVAWSEPIPLVPGTVGFSPWIAGGQAGQAFAIWEASPDGGATFGNDADWYLYWARISNGTIITGTTTAAPVFHGKQSVGFAEFDTVRLDKDGFAHIGASMPQGKANNVHWQAMYQRQALGPPT
ncbi:MAG: sialidase family protein [bacterium]